IDNATFDWSLGPKTGKMPYAFAWNRAESASVAQVEQAPAVSSNVGTEAPVPVSGQVAQKLALSTPIAPTCGPTAMMARYHGTIHVQATVSPEGNVTALSPISGYVQCVPFAIRVE